MLQHMEWVALEVWQRAHPTAPTLAGPLQFFVQMVLTSKKRVMNGCSRHSCMQSNSGS
jgi:hypothetical protein